MGTRSGGARSATRLGRRAPARDAGAAERVRLVRGERTGLLTDTSALVCACRRLILVPPGRSSRCDAQLCGTLRAQLVADMANNPALPLLANIFGIFIPTTFLIVL